MVGIFYSEENKVKQQNDSKHGMRGTLPKRMRGARFGNYCCKELRLVQLLLLKNSCRVYYILFPLNLAFRHALYLHFSFVVFLKALYHVQSDDDFCRQDTI